LIKLPEFIPPSGTNLVMTVLASETIGSAASSGKKLTPAPTENAFASP
jgi:hypothetical protein